MPLWLLIKSINGQEYKSCFASEGSLAETIGISRPTARRRLSLLRDQPGLLLELSRPRRGTKRIPTSVRFALEPAQADYWAGIIIAYRIPDIAEQSGLDSGWVAHSISAVNNQARAAKSLAGILASEIG